MANNNHSFNEAKRYIASMGASGQLRLSNMGLTRLPELPRGVKVLLCDRNYLTELPVLPRGLKVLVCDHNQLTSLPTLPEGLEDLHCAFNQIIFLPRLPSTLKRLICNNNQLLLLPSLPASLEVLICYNNQLSVLPTLPVGLKKLECYNNNLTTLPDLPVTVYDYHILPNPLQPPFTSADSTRAYYADLRRRGRDITALQLSLGKSAIHSPGPLNVIGKYLSGKVGNNNSALPLEEQQRQLRMNTLRSVIKAPGTRKGGRRKTRRGRKGKSTTRRR